MTDQSTAIGGRDRKRLIHRLCLLLAGALVLSLATWAHRRAAPQAVPVPEIPIRIVGEWLPVGFTEQPPPLQFACGPNEVLVLRRNCYVRHHALGGTDGELVLEIPWALGECREAYHVQGTTLCLSGYGSTGPWAVSPPETRCYTVALYGRTMTITDTAGAHKWVYRRAPWWRTCQTSIRTTVSRYRYQRLLPGLLQQFTFFLVPLVVVLGVLARATLTRRWLRGRWVICVVVAATVTIVGLRHAPVWEAAKWLTSGVVAAGVVRAILRKERALRSVQARAVVEDG